MAYQGNNQNRGEPRRSEQQSAVSSPRPVAVTFYSNKDNKEIHPKLLNEWAEQQAKLFPDGKERLSKSQIRRFFGAIKNLHLQLEAKRPWPQILPLFKMFQSKVSYAERAGNKTIPKEFADFLKTNITNVGDDEDYFKAFVLYFEAVLGFAYGLNKIGD